MARACSNIPFPLKPLRVASTMSRLQPRSMGITTNDSLSLSRQINLPLASIRLSRSHLLVTSCSNSRECTVFHRHYQCLPIRLVVSNLRYHTSVTSLCNSLSCHTSSSSILLGPHPVCKNCVRRTRKKKQRARPRRLSPLHTFGTMPAIASRRRSMRLSITWKNNSALN